MRFAPFARMAGRVWTAWSRRHCNVTSDAIGTVYVWMGRATVRRATRDATVMWTRVRRRAARMACARSRAVSTRGTSVFVIRAGAGRRATCRLKCFAMTTLTMIMVRVLGFTHGAFWCELHVDLTLVLWERKKVFRSKKVSFWRERKFLLSRKKVPLERKKVPFIEKESSFGEKESSFYRWFSLNVDI